MKYLKIILGVLLLFGAGSEYIHASRALGSFFSPGIIVGMLALVVLCTWLIGSGLRQEKFQFKSLDSLKFFGISLFTFAAAAFFTLSSRAAPDNFVSVNGLRIPINHCVDGSERIIPDKEAREAYCLCLAEKITADSLLRNQYKQELEQGGLGKILMDLQFSESLEELGIEECLPQVEMEWTNNLANSMKAQWKQELKGTDFEQTNDIEVYCDCLITEYRKYPLSQIIEDGFQESKLGIGIESDCVGKSMK